jgi:histidinol-phosphate aminotransferase
LQRLGIDPDDVLDFSSNINPYGPSPAVRAALANVPLDRYPDRESLALRAALAKFVGVPADQIVLGNGASELIALAVIAFGRPQGMTLIISPAYSEYFRATRLRGGGVAVWGASPEDNFTPNVSAIADLLETESPDLVFVCTPNNPTGALFPRDALDRLARQHPGALFIVDEAYLPFATDQVSAVDLKAANVLVLRSMTKDFGLAGVRLGYAVGTEHLVHAIRQAQVPWSVSGLAQAAGIAALGDLAHRNDSLELLDQARVKLIAGLRQLGLPPLPSSMPFLLVRVSDPRAFRQTLLARHRILVRVCASFGLPEYVRISTRRPEENERLLAAIREVR